MLYTIDSISYDRKEPTRKMEERSKKISNTVTASSLIVVSYNTLYLGKNSFTISFYQMWNIKYLVSIRWATDCRLFFVVGRAGLFQIYQKKTIFPRKMRPHYLENLQLEGLLQLLLLSLFNLVVNDVLNLQSFANYLSIYAIYDTLFSCKIYFDRRTLGWLARAPSQWDETGTGSGSRPRR